ncbi:MAG: hypothetical protein KC933_24280 [Myxococcales bacterium]|nr:hypothetical protein [Myxococcales bacterium]
MLSAIWEASSRVGVRISARTAFEGTRRCSLLKIWSMGRQNAAVLPVPVCATPSMSLPCRRPGMAAAWMGVGVS